MRLPGFVDLQANGHAGTDFSSPALTAGDFAKACRMLFAKGTAVFLPTVITGTEDMYEKNLKLMSAVIADEGLAGRIPGFHMEGPFISSEKGYVGAHNPSLTRLPDIALLERMCEWSAGKLKLITIAAELPGAEELAAKAVSMGIVVSIGHSAAGQDAVLRLYEAGASAVTHLCNGMGRIIPKFDNLIWPILADDTFSAMLIADGHHLPPNVLRAVIRAKSPAKIIVVSDAACLAGLPPGSYQTSSDILVIEPSGRLYCPSKGCLAGSTSTMIECMNFLASLELLSPEELISVGLKNPAELIGLDPLAVPYAGNGVEYDSASHCFTLL